MLSAPEAPPALTADDLALLEIEQDWGLWLMTLFPTYFSDAGGEPIAFAPHHIEFYDWLWSIERTAAPRPLIAVWPRGGGKSTNAEIGCVALGARDRRSYGWYVCATQEQADDHVSNIASLLESPVLGDYYPLMGQRALGKYGNVKGWRRNRLRTAQGFTVDALGLDTARRGARLEEQRPDFMVFDDIDQEDDSTETIKKKTAALTKKLLPAGTPTTAVLVCQNLIHAQSIVSQLAHNKADFLSERIVSGPHPALRNARIWHDGTKWRVDGIPTWAGQSVERCEAEINRIGPAAWKAECQHDILNPEDQLFPTDAWARYCREIFLRNSPRADFVTLDAADKDGIGNDPSVAVAWKKLGSRLYVLARLRGKWTYPDFKIRVRDFWERWGGTLVVEDAGNGRALYQDIRGEQRSPFGDRFAFMPVAGVRPGGNKWARAAAAAPSVQAGLVCLPDDADCAEWVADWIEEHRDFPRAQHDDQVDNTSMACWYARHVLGSGETILSLIKRGAQPLTMGTR